MSPAIGSINRKIRRPTVDLPQPVSPTSASVLPACTLKSMPSTALTVAIGRPNGERRATKSRVRPSTSSRALTPQSLPTVLLHTVTNAPPPRPPLAEDGLRKPRLRKGSEVQNGSLAESRSCREATLRSSREFPPGDRAGEERLEARSYRGVAVP